MAQAVRFQLVLALCGLLGGLLAAAPAAAGPDPWQRDPVLSRLLIKKLLTDPAGFQWVATDEGVFRYDGYELLPLARLVRPGSCPAPKGLASTLCLDPAGHLWLGTDAGLFCFTLRTGALRRMVLPQPARNTPKAAPPAVLMLFRHPRSGHLWVSYYDGSVAVLDANRDGQLVSPRRYLPGMGSLFQPDGSATGVWVSFSVGYRFDSLARREQLTPAGVARLGLVGSVHNYATTPFTVVPMPGTLPLRLFSTSALYELGDHGRLREISRWLPAGREENFLPASTRGDSVCEWVAQHHYLRLLVRGPHAGTVLARDSLRLADTPFNHFHHNYVVFRDALGVEWCYTPFWRGVYKRRATVPQVVRPLWLAGGRPMPSARGITRLADGRLLLGTYGGPFVQAADSPRAPLRPLAIPRPASRPLPVPFDALTTRARPCTTVIAEETVGVSVLDPRTGNCPLVALAPDERHQPTHFSTLTEGQRGRVWVGTDSGLFQLDFRAHQLRRYQPPGPAPLPLLQIMDLSADATTGHLWLATQQGLYRLAPATGELRRVGATPARPLPTDDFLCVAAAGPGRAWAGTRNEGLLLVDVRRGLLRQLSWADGLPSATVGTVLCRPDGAVWAGTYAGLIRYDPAPQRLAVFGTSAGLTDPEMNRNSAYADPRTGTLLFGGVGGVFQVAPTTRGEAESDRRTPIRLLVTAVGKSNPNPTAGDDRAPTPLRSGAPVPALQLGANAADFVEIRLALTALLTPDLTHYSYRLHPAADKDGPLPAWQPTTRQLVLQGLAAGDYIVEIRAETGGGQLAANTVRVPLHVARVWWQHPLVGLLAAIGLVGLAYGLFWLQGRRARRDALRDARLRDELAANLHDEVGGLLTKISLMAEVLQQPADEPAAPSAAPAPADDPALHQLAARLLLNSRAAVQALRDVVWSIDSRANSVQALLDRMEDHLDQTAAAAGLVHTFEAGPLPHLQALRPLVRKHVYLVFKEAVTNAVRHGKGATMLQVRLLREGSYFVLEITDDGQNAAAPGRSGLGLRSMAARAQAIGGTLSTGSRSDGQAGYEVRLRVKG